jgi:hypothetical protein
MKHVYFPLWSLAAAAMLLLPGRVAAQDTMPGGKAPTPAGKAPTILVCRDGWQERGPGNQACAYHGGVDSVATRAAMRAGGGAGQAHPALVICGDGSSAPTGPTACRSHGGVDSQATRAAMNQRFHGQNAGGRPPSADSTESDSVHVRPPKPGAAQSDTAPNPESP